MKSFGFGFIILALFFAGSMLYYAHSKESCDEKGGTLVRDAVTGFYKCVEEVK